MVTTSSYELSAEYPNRRRNEWLTTLFCYDDQQELVVSITTADSDIQVALERVFRTARLALEALEERQLLLDVDGCLVRYGDVIVSG